MTTYTLNFTDVTVMPITILRGDIDETSTDIALFGRLRLEYGEQLNEALLHLLENFSSHEDEYNPGNPVEINSPVHGQFWHNKTDGLIYYYCKGCHNGGDIWVPLRRSDDVAALYGQIVNGGRLPQPVSLITGRPFEYEECIWSVAPFEYSDVITHMNCYTDSDANVTMNYTRESDGVVVNGVANYLIIGIRGNHNIGEIITPPPDPTPTETPSPSATPSSTPDETPTPTPTTTASQTPTPTPSTSVGATPSPTPSKTPPPTPSKTPSPTQTKTPAPTPTRTPAPTQTQTQTPTPLPSPPPTNSGMVLAPNMFCSSNITLVTQPYFTFHSDGTASRNVAACNAGTYRWLDPTGFYPGTAASDYTWEVTSIMEENGANSTLSIGDSGTMASPPSVGMTVGTHTTTENTEATINIRITGPFNSQLIKVGIVIRYDESGG